jgi:hypothetical protein
MRPVGAPLLAQQPPGTAFRRLGTAQGQGPPGTASSRQVQVDARPLTQQGIAGMRTAAAGGRQVREQPCHRRAQHCPAGLPADLSPV